MEYATTGDLELIERFDYVTIDLDKQFFYIEVVHLKSNKAVLKISINLEKDETVVEENIIQYDTLHINALLQGLKCVAQTCIDHNLSNQEE
ncbi:protein Dhp61, partial [Bacillus sp. HC-TM]